MMDRRTGRGFYEILRLAIADITEHGFDTSGRLAFWTDQLRQAAMQTMTPVWRMEALLRTGLSAIYRRLVERGQIARYHPGIARFTVERVAPHLRAPANITFNPVITTNALGSFNVKTDGYIQGFALDNPAARYFCLNLEP